MRTKITCAKIVFGAGFTVLARAAGDSNSRRGKQRFTRRCKMQRAPAQTPNTHKYRTTKIKQHKINQQ
jgi:hypothetical protein